jgi:hypothetical protein
VSRLLSVSPVLLSHLLVLLLLGQLPLLVVEAGPVVADLRLATLLREGEPLPVPGVPEEVAAAVVAVA